MFKNLIPAKRVQDYLDKMVFPDAPANLYDPLHYVLSLAGKRIRPMLALMGADLFNENLTESVLPASAAIEFFHNFTLIHDDIMDKAPLRRGEPSVHIKWNDNVAILSGDVLLIKAYQELAKCPEDKIPSLLRLFNTTSVEVCEGQQYDMDFETRDNVSEVEYVDMIRLKTSVLLGCALKMGAIIADADKKNQDLLYDFGVNLGVAFQLQDDILDVYGNPETFGKQVGGDILSNKKTILYSKLRACISDEDLPVLKKLLASDLQTVPDKVENMKALYAKYDIHNLVTELKEEFTNVAYQQLAAIQVDESKKKALFALADALMYREQ